MKSNSLAWVMLSAAAIALGAVELAACSSDNGGSGLPTGNGNDATTNKEGGGNGEGGNNGDGGKPGEDGGAEEDGPVECGTAPKLRPRPTNDAGAPLLNFLCPFSAPQGQPWEYCDSGTHCCIPYTTGIQSSCETACPNEADGGPFNGRDNECLDPIDCTVAGSGGPVCCATGLVQTDPVCNTNFGKGFKGTKCQASCNTANNEFVLCQSDDHCDTGTCVPMSAAGAQFGACQ